MLPKLEGLKQVSPLLLMQLVDRLLAQIPKSVQGELDDQLLILLQRLYEMLPEGNYKVKATAMTHKVLRSILFGPGNLNIIAVRFYS